jgi:hypothetical protein
LWSVLQSAPSKILINCAISYLSICDQSGCESSHQESSRCTYERCNAGNIVPLKTKCFDVADFTIPTPLSLLSWCRLSFQMFRLENTHFCSKIP